MKLGNLIWKNSYSEFISKESLSKAYKVYGIKNEKRNVDRCKVLQGKGSDAFNSRLQQAEDVHWSIFSPSLLPWANCYFPCNVWFWRSVENHSLGSVPGKGQNRKTKTQGIKGPILYLVFYHCHKNCSAASKEKHVKPKKSLYLKNIFFMSGLIHYTTFDLDLLWPTF